MKFIRISLAAFQASLYMLSSVSAADAGTAARVRPGDGMIAAYFEQQTAALAQRCLADIKTLDDWNARKTLYRRQLEEMLSLAPMPERTDLQAAVTKRIEQDEFIVENLHYESMPGLYVTANLYLPKGLEKPAPAILYVCGHSRQVRDGVSFGNKANYQHHGAWFARNGYVCLTIDTIQLGEILGLHHGTYREGMWWWNSRGYTSAGVEAWNSIRALDYLQARPEVDRTRLGVTGRSGGGAYSWWLVALDDRIKAAAPVAGIADLQNHIVDGTVEGHCDCMFTVNTYGWDYAQIAALAAPRPLLIANSDKDTIFPLDGVYRIHTQVRRIYELHNAGDKLGLLITDGPHRDTQDLQLPVFRFFNRHLKGEDPIIEMVATKFFAPERLRAFDQLPADERSSRIHETFVPKAAVPPVPRSDREWHGLRDQWKADLQEKVFRGWPQAESIPLQLRLGAESAFGSGQLHIYEFESQPEIELHLFVYRNAVAAEPKRVVLHVLDESGWKEWSERIAFLHDSIPQYSRQLNLSPIISDSKEARFERGQAWAQTLPESAVAHVFLAPRGIGPTAWNPDPRKQVQIRRRFMLLGQTLDSMRVWDIRRAIQAVRQLEGLKEKPLVLHASRAMGANALYASVFEQNLRALRLEELPSSHEQGPDYLNVLRVLDIPQVTAIAAETCRVEVTAASASDWEFPQQVARQLGWPENRFRVRP